MSVSLRVEQKTRRLLREHRVAIIDGAVTVAVQGDTALYCVTVYSSGRTSCLRGDGVPCPASGSCSHGQAALRLVRAEQVTA